MPKYKNNLVVCGKKNVKIVFWYFPKYKNKLLVRVQNYMYGIEQYKRI